MIGYFMRPFGYHRSFNKKHPDGLYCTNTDLSQTPKPKKERLLRLMRSKQKTKNFKRPYNREPLNSNKRTAN